MAASRLPFHAPCVQIAGIRDEQEVRLLLEAEVDYLGFPFRLPVHAPDLSEASAAELIRKTGIHARAVCITYETTPEAIVGLCHTLGVAAVQLHAPMPLGALQELRRLAPELGILHSLVIGRDPLDQLAQQLQRLAPFVDGFLTDTFDPTTGASGATGRIHDWQTSAAIVRAAPRPVILAGGPTADNVAAAIAAVRPAGVDAHTGVEDHAGRKDPDRVQAFVREARKGFALLETQD